MPPYIKKHLKRLVVQMISFGSNIFWTFSKNNLVILTYHRTLPKNSSLLINEQPGMVVNPESFNMHLTELKKHFEIIHLDDAIRNAKTLAKKGKNYCVITFDDGWKDNFDFAFPILKKHKAPATIFLVSDYIETNNTFWPGRLSVILNHLLSKTNNNDNILENQPDSEEMIWLKNCINQHSPQASLFIDTVISQAKKFPDNIINHHLDRLEAELKLTRTNLNREILNWNEINELNNSGLIQFGCHTKTHARLNHLNSQQQLKEELVQSKVALKHHLSQPIDLFCYPNGDTNKDAEQLIEEQYLAAVTTRKGLNKLKNLSPYKLNRITMHQDGSYDKTRFSAKITGLT